MLHRGVCHTLNQLVERMGKLDAARDVVDESGRLLRFDNLPHIS
jgi:hypothetical protein